MACFYLALTVYRVAIGAIIIGRKVSKQRTRLLTYFDYYDYCFVQDDDNDLTARKAFEAMLRISLLQPTSPKFHNFSEIVRKVAAERYNYNFFEGEEVS